jgi:hypothetical protein
MTAPADWQGFAEMTGGASGAAAGLYLLLPASLVAQVSGVLNAWYLLLPPRPGGSSPSGPA